MLRKRTLADRELRTMRWVSLWLLGAALACGGETEVVEGGVPPNDAGDGGAPDTGVKSGVLCGSSTCLVPAEYCCVAGSAPAMICLLVDGGVGSCNFRARCDGPEDCSPNGHCCGPSGAFAQASCSTTPCPVGPTYCHVGADCPTGNICCPDHSFGWPHSECSSGSTCP